MGDRIYGAHVGERENLINLPVPVRLNPLSEILTDDLSGLLSIETEVVGHGRVPLQERDPRACRVARRLQRAAPSAHAS